jgi:hypothetical protein
MPFKLDKKKLLIIGGVVLLIIAIIVVVVMTSKPTSKSSASTSQSNNSQNNRTGSPARNTGTGTGTTGTGTGTTGNKTPAKVKNTYLSFLYAGNTYFLVLNNGAPVSATTDITNATPVMLVPKVLSAIVGIPAQNVNAIQTTSGQFVNLTYSATQNVINANQNMVSVSDTFYYNSSGTVATMIINSANAIQTYFANLSNENDPNYWYLAYFNGTSFSFNPAAAGNVVIQVVTQ